MSFGLAIAIRAFTQPGGKVLMQTPIYPPFTELTKANGRVCSMNPLKFVNGRYEVDFEDFEPLILTVPSSCSAVRTTLPAVYFQRMN